MITAAGRTGNKRQRVTAPKLSRAVVREVKAGSHVMCAACGDLVRFRARLKLREVICNVYVDGVWARVEHYHADCYATAFEPYGSADASRVGGDRRVAAASASATANA